MRFRMTFGNQIILAILVVIGVSVATYSISTYKVAKFSSPKNHNIKDFPLVEQPDQITCGPTSALMLLRYYGNDAVTLDQVKVHSKTHWFDYNEEPMGMTAPDVLTSALNKLDLPSKMMKGTIPQLKKLISENRPSIVLVRSGEYTWHYVVVTGYDEDSITFADPSWGINRTLKNEDFYGTWSFATDMSGEESKDVIISGLLSLAEVHPFTMIVPSQSPIL